MSNSLLPGVGRSLFGVVLLSVALSVGLYGVFMSITNESYDDGGALFSQDDIYLDECGACHLAYPPGLLPEPSWRLLLAHLDDHNQIISKPSIARIKDARQRHQVYQMLAFVVYNPAPIPKWASLA